MSKDMEKDREEGGSAFPSTDTICEKCHCVHSYTTGMTLRDYFAAKALQGMLASCSAGNNGVESYAREAYAFADAMLRARQS